MTFIVFAACAVVLQFAGYRSFRNQLHKQETRSAAFADKAVAVNREDAALKKRGINLPGYNSPDLAGSARPFIADAEK